ncbi:MAG: hypothetical protein JNN30_06220 [Rhodanobacteraceae bacterium]|nr:hypothetical protein [Rhodanobacteraceae bacterium]
MGWVCTPFGDFETTPLAHDAERHGLAGVVLFVRTEGDVDLVVYVGQTESLSDCASGAAWDQARSLGARSVHAVLCDQLRETGDGGEIYVDGRRIGP